MASGKIKGITIQFRGETTQLERAIKDVNKETAKLDAELKQVNSALRFNPGNADLLAQKQELLTQKVKGTEDKLNSLKEAQRELQNDPSVDKNSAEWRSLEREIITTDSKLKKFQGDLRKVTMENKRLYRMGAAFQNVGNKVSAAGQKLRGLSTAAGVVVAGMGVLTYRAGALADDLNTLSKVTGISTHDLQMYAASASLVDVSVEDMARAHQRLKKAMNSSSSAKYFEQLGIETRNADGSLRDANEVFDETIAALGKMENETERDAISMALMGKSATNLNPLIEDGGQTYEKVSKIMKKYGLEPVSQEDLDRANEFNDSIDVIKLVFLQAAQIIGTKIAGYLVPLAEKITQKVSEFAQKFAGLSGETLAKFGAIMTAVALLSPALIILGKVISGVGMALQTVVKVVGALSKAFAFLAANPIVAVIAIIGLLTAAFIHLWRTNEKFRQFFLNMWDAFKQKVNGFVTAFKTAKAAIVTVWQNLPDTLRKIWSRVGEGLKGLGTKLGGAVTNALRGGVNGMIATIEKVINLGIDKINAAVDWVNKVVPGKKLDIGHVGHLSLPRLARGGIVDSATLAVIGEGSSSEAVVPLDEMWKKMARMLNGGGQPMVINVYGAAGQNVEELAAAVQRRIIASEKRRREAWA